jgi:hypothetical protein
VTGEDVRLRASRCIEGSGLRESGDCRSIEGYGVWLRVGGCGSRRSVEG